MIYEYECSGCGDVREVERKMSEAEQTLICSQCDTEFKRKWTSPAISFKGSGFYSTDHRK